MGTRLHNPTPVNLETMYAGVPFFFPATKTVILKTVRKPNEVLNPEEIAAACFSNLAPRGLVMVNDDDPQSPEEMREQGYSALESFIRENHRTFNELQITLANEGRPKPRVPKDLRDLNKLLHAVLLKGRESEPDADPGEASETEIISESTYARLKNKSAVEVKGLLERIKTAMSAGKIDEVVAMLESVEEEPKAVATGPAQPVTGGAKDDEDAPEPDSEAMETSIVDAPHRKGHEPSRAFDRQQKEQAARRKK